MCVSPFKALVTKALVLVGIGTGLLYGWHWYGVRLALVRGYFMVGIGRLALVRGYFLALVRGYFNMALDMALYGIGTGLLSRQQSERTTEHSA